MNIVEDDIMEQLGKLGVKPSIDYPQIQRLRTGMVEFDLAIGGGIPLERITQIYGPDGTGKTLISIIAASACIARSEKVMFINLESRLDPKWTSAFGVVPGENLFTAEAPSGTEALDYILSILRNNKDLGFKLIILDTIALAYPQASVIANMEKDKRMASRASLITDFLFKAIPELVNSGCSLTILNQARSNFAQFGDDIQPSGGWGLQHGSDVRIRLTSPEKLAIKSGGQIAATGFKIGGKIKKNKTATKYDTNGDEREFKVSVLVHPTPFHWAANELFTVAKDLGIFQNKSGDVYTGSGSVMFGEIELGTSQDSARATIDQDNELFEAVNDAAYERMGNDPRSDLRGRL